jgi:hypothetical protein
LIQRYFGDEARFTLEKQVQGRFIKLGQLLEGSGYPQNGTSKYQHRQNVADDLNNFIYDLDIRMISDIQEGCIGAFRTTDTP